MPRWFNLANFFTLLRLILVPYVIGAILDGRHTPALELFFAAALTDVIDGILARNLRQATQVGAYLDPIADKCLLSGIFLAFGATGSAPWWFVAVVLGRDIYILLAVVAVMALTKVRKFPPSRWGKISTFVQIATAVTWMVENIWQIACFACDCVRNAMGLRGFYDLERHSLHAPRYSNVTRTLTGCPLGSSLKIRMAFGMTRYLPARHYRWFGISAVVLAGLCAWLGTELARCVHSGRAVSADRRPAVLPGLPSGDRDSRRVRVRGRRASSPGWTSAAWTAPAGFLR